jgi:hypothetical protein
MGDGSEPVGLREGFQTTRRASLLAVPVLYELFLRYDQRLNNRKSLGIKDTGLAINEDVCKRGLASAWLPYPRFKTSVPGNLNESPILIQTRLASVSPCFTKRA